MDNNNIVEVTEEHAKAYLEDQYADTPLKEGFFGDPKARYTLTQGAAKVLAAFDGYNEEDFGYNPLSLNGLITLPAEIAEILANTNTYELSFYELKEIDADAASNLAKFKGNSLDLSGLEQISDQAAAAFAGFKGHLDLSGLKKLSEASARSLASSGSPDSGPLNLSGLEELSDGAAEALTTFKFGDLKLNGIRWLSDAAAEALSKGFRGDLELDGLLNSDTYWLAPDGSRWKKKKEATDAGFAAKEVEKVTRELSEAALISLANLRGRIDLGGLKNLTPDAAKAFGMRPIRYGKAAFSKKLKLSEIEADWLYFLAKANKTNIRNTIAGQTSEDWIGFLSGLKELEEVSSDFLVQHPTLQVENINELSGNGAQKIAQHIGSVTISCPRERVESDGVESDGTDSFVYIDEDGNAWTTRKIGTLAIVDEAFEILTTHQGAIELSDLETMTPSQALCFSKHKWYLNLSGLKAIDEDLAKALTQHQGILQVDGEACSDEAKAVFEENEHVIAW